MATQKDQLAALTARLDALETENKAFKTENKALKKTQRVDHGGIWLSKPEGKSDLSATLRCPSCEQKQRFYFKDSAKYGVFIDDEDVKDEYEDGHYPPVYRCTFAKADASAE